MIRRWPEFGIEQRVHLQHHGETDVEFERRVRGKAPRRRSWLIRMWDWVRS